MNTVAGCDRARPRRKLVPRLGDKRVERRHTIRTPMPVGIDHHPIKGRVAAPDAGHKAIGGQSKLPGQIAPPSEYGVRISGCGFFPSLNCRLLVPLLGFGVPIETSHEYRDPGTSKSECNRKVVRLDLRHARAADVRNGALLLKTRRLWRSRRRLRHVEADKIGMTVTA